MSEKTALTSATELAAKSPMHFPNESAEYRSARTALLAEEIELRRHIERVSAQRRALPPGGPVPDGYTFITENGPRTFADRARGATGRHIVGAGRRAIERSLQPALASFFNRRNTKAMTKTMIIPATPQAASKYAAWVIG